MFHEGDLLSFEHQKVIEQWLPNYCFSLIYKESQYVSLFFFVFFFTHPFHRDGPKNEDPQGATLTVIQSHDGFLFGIYTSSSDIADDNTFIFTLSNPYSIPPTKFHVMDPQKATDECSFTFGSPPLCFEDTANQGKLLFTTSENFTTKEVEVYSVSPM